MWKRSVITDEISQDLERALALAREFGLEGVDIRSVWDRRIHELAEADLERLRAMVEGAGLRVAALAPPFLKCPIDSLADWEAHLAILERTIAAAHRLGTRLVRGFTFWRQGDLATHWPTIVARYREIAPLVERAGIVLAVENEPSCLIGTVEPLVRLLEAVGSPNIRALWDPANGFVDGELPTRAVYEQVRPYLVHMHLKDGRRGPDGRYEHTVVGEGQIDYITLFRWLEADGYEGFVALETHYRPRPVDPGLVAQPGGRRFSELGEEATRACLLGWQRVLAAARGSDR